MATYTSALVTAADPPVLPPSGVVSWVRGRVTLGSAWANNPDVLEFVILPDNAVVCGMRLFGDDIGAADMDIGHSTTQAAYATYTGGSGFDWGAAANHFPLTLVQGADAVATVQQETIIVTSTGAVTGGATGDVYMDVYFTSPWAQ